MREREREIFVLLPILSYRPAPVVRHTHDDRDPKRSSSASRSTTGIGVSRSAPRLNIGAATKQILSGIGHGATRTSREGRRREKGEGQTTMVTAEKVTGNQHPLEQNRVPNTGRSEHMTVAPYPPPSSYLSTSPSMSFSLLRITVPLPPPPNPYSTLPPISFTLLSINPHSTPLPSFTPSPPPKKKILTPLPHILHPLSLTPLPPPPPPPPPIFHRVFLSIR